MLLLYQRLFFSSDQDYNVSLKKESTALKQINTVILEKAP